MTIQQLESLAFADIVNFEESVGVASNRGVIYRTATYVALDTTGAERKYKVRVSSLGKVKIEDFGKTRNQFQIEEKQAWENLLPATRAAVEALGLPLDWIGNKTAVGRVLQGENARGALSGALGNRPAKEKFLELFPETKTIDDAIKHLRKFYSDFTNEAARAGTEQVTK